jgi:hypothetical protein
VKVSDPARIEGASAKKNSVVLLLLRDERSFFIRSNRKNKHREISIPLMKMKRPGGYIAGPFSRADYAS